MIFNCRATDHGRGRQSYLSRADMFGIYDPASCRVYLVPVSELPGFEGRLRVHPTRNNQKLHVRFARDYEVGEWTPEDLEAVARAGQSTSPDLALTA